MLNNFLEIFLYSVLMGCLAAFPGAFVFNYLWTIVYVPLNKEKIEAKAIAAGHVVHGKLIDAREVLGDQDVPAPTGKWHCEYQYEYKGKTYRYRGYDACYPEDEITLYFESDPGKSCPLSDLGYRETKWMRFYRPVAVVGFIAFFIYEAIKYVF